MQADIRIEAPKGHLGDVDVIDGSHAFGVRGAERVSHLAGVSSSLSLIVARTDKAALVSVNLDDHAYCDFDGAAESAVRRETYGEGIPEYGHHRTPSRVVPEPVPHLVGGADGAL